MNTEPWKTLLRRFTPLSVPVSDVCRKGARCEFDTHHDRDGIAPFVVFTVRREGVTPERFTLTRRNALKLSVHLLRSAFGFR